MTSPAVRRMAHDYRASARPASPPAAAFDPSHGHFGCAVVALSAVSVLTVRLRLSLLLATFVLLACGGDDGGVGADMLEPTGATPLVDHALWDPVSASEDPFDDRPADVACDLTGYMAEDLAGEQAFSVRTRLCAYMTACQPTLAALGPGDEVKVRVWNFELSAPEDPDAEAHLAISLDGTTTWETRIPIPSPSGLHDETFAVDAEYPAATQVCFHAHNHGLNEYDLIEVSRLEFDP